MSNNIVQVNVYQNVGATPSILQQTAALVSVGATDLAPGTVQLTTQYSDLTALVNIPISALSVATSILSVTLSEALPSNYTVGSTVALTITGAVPNAYNGTYTMTIESSTSLQVAFTTSVAAASTLGYAQLPEATELLAMGSTFYAQGTSASVYVLELGTEATVVESIANLATYISNPSKRFYAYCVPAEWDTNSALIALAKNYDANESLTYFFINTAYATTNVYQGIKSVVPFVQDATAPVTEYDAAGLMWQYISASPSEVNKVPPMSNRYLTGVTTYTGTNVQIATLIANDVNYVGTGAEGGISNTLVVPGCTADGNDMTYWYSVDWVQINVHLSLANATINGSNVTANPLYYNQDGVDRLQKTAQSTVNTGGTYGLVNGNPTVTAVSYSQYITDNPNDYKIGRYAGLALTYTPNRGFAHIIFNITVTIPLA